MKEQHQLQVIFKDVKGNPCANTKYELVFKGQKLRGKTDDQGRSQLLRSHKPEEVEIWVLQDGLPPHRVGQTQLRLPGQKPTVVARQTAKPKLIKTQTEKHDTNPQVKVPLKKYSLQFEIPTFSCSGKSLVSYRMVQDDIVLAENKTAHKTTRVYTDSNSEIALYIAGDKRYKVGETYTPERNAGENGLRGAIIQPFVTAKPTNQHGDIRKCRIFDVHDWVDVSKIYDQHHDDITPESAGIYIGHWDPKPQPKDTFRHYKVQVDGRLVELYWDSGSCSGGLKTGGHTTFMAKDDVNGTYMTVEQVIARTHPKVFKVLFDVIRSLNLTYVQISSSWRPHQGSPAHREGRALDITVVRTDSSNVLVKDFLPHTQTVDKTDTPSGKEPDLITQVRKALYEHPDVEQIFDPWHMMNARGSTFDKSFIDNVVHKNGDNACIHRNHLHFHIKLEPT